MEFQIEKIKKDLAWYLIGTMLPMLFLFVRSPIYTRIFTPEQYGTYSIVYLVFTYISAVSYQGISNGAWRYFLKYKHRNRIQLYHSIIILLYIGLVLIVLIGSTVWYVLTTDPYLRKLIVLGFLFSLSNELFNSLFIPLRIEGKARKYNLINSLRTGLSFFLLILLTFAVNLQIEAFFIAPIIFNIVFIIPSIRLLPHPFRIELSRLTRLHILRFIRYGSANLIYNIALFLLISADRFVIAHFNGYDKVGIYHQTYNIAQLSLGALLSVFSSAVNPLVLSSLEQSTSSSRHLIRKIFNMQLYLFIPSTLLLGIVSKDLAFLLLGEDFREASSILPILFWGVFFNGMNYLANSKIKFQNRLKSLIIVSVFAALLNLILNLFLIPQFGYKVAAITTFLSYLFLSVGMHAVAQINMLPQYKDMRSLGYYIIVFLFTGTLCHLLNRYFYTLHAIIRIVGISTLFISFYLVLTWHCGPFRKNELKKLSVK